MMLLVSEQCLKASPQLLNQLRSSLLDSVLATEPAPVVQAGQTAASLSTGADLATALQALSAGQVAPAAPQFRAVILELRRPQRSRPIPSQTGVAHDIVPGEAIHQVIGPVDTVLGTPVFIVFHPVIEALSVFTSAGTSPLMLLTIDIPSGRHSGSQVLHFTCEYDLDSEPVACAARTRGRLHRTDDFFWKP